jgi:hypothetical protein
MSSVQAGHQLLTTNRKALVINLDESRYGTFAEIGAGQEVVRHFFQAGGAAGTIAKTMSAYDMAFSDAIYGRSKRYVSQERLTTMLEHEYELLRERLQSARGERTRFFVFADTVAARSYRGNNDCHGWLGVRFQTEPGRESNDILVHVRMWDRDNVAQQDAIGVLGVNLLYGAFYLLKDPAAFARSLIDNLSAERVEVDVIRFTGPDLAHVDQRLVALELVERGMTNAVLYGPDGVALQPSEAFYKKAVLALRGSFHPITRVHLDMMRCAGERFAHEMAVAGKSVLPLLEMSMRKLEATGGVIDHRDFLDRVDTVSAAGCHVLVSNYRDYFRLTQYFRRYTPEMIGFVAGVRALARLLEESEHEHLDGGILEAFGRLFKSNVRLYAYPRLRDETATAGGEVLDATALEREVPPNLRHLYLHLLENGLILPLEGFDPHVLPVRAREALRAIQAGDPRWETMVPAPAAAIIRARRLFGLPGAGL